MGEDKTYRNLKLTEVNNLPRKLDIAELGGELEEINPECSRGKIRRWKYEKGQETWRIKWEV